MKALLLILVLGSQAFGADTSLIRKSVVKIVSTLQGVSAELRGSGLLFERSGKRYVLTSDHVIGHTDSSLGEHTATSSVTGESLKLKYLGAEWGNGLALLEVLNDKHPENAVPYGELLVPTKAKVGDLVSFYGYPFESTDLTEETFAKLLNFASPAPYFVFAKTLVEMEAAVGEFGMSGGAAFSATGEFLGVLAYQRILDESLAVGSANRVYALPPSVVVAWLDHYFQLGAKYQPYFSEPWFAQGDPRQLLLTNDGLLLMFRTFQGKYRFGIGRMEHLMVLKDGPTIPFNDKRGFMKAFHKFMKDNPLQPSEFGLVDRSSGKPLLREVHYPAEVLTSFDEAGLSLFLILGERHEDRYKRVWPLVDTLEKATVALATAMASTEPAWKALETDLSSLLAKLKAMPANPANPGAPGANEFFSADWLSGVAFQVEANLTLAGWTAVASKAPTQSSAVKKALQALIDGFRVSEVTP